MRRLFLPRLHNLTLHTLSTDHPNLGEGPSKPHFTYPKAPNATAIVHGILPLTNKTNLEETLRHFSSYKTRYYNSFTGKASSEWLLEKIQNYTIEYAKKEVLELIEVKPVRHPWLQTSIVGDLPALQSAILNVVLYTDYPYCAQGLKAN